MARHQSTRLRRSNVGRPRVELLEGRALPSGLWTVGYPSALGLGATGKYSAIHANAVATDPAGNTVVTGSFRGTVGFEPRSSGSTFTTNNTQDTFVADYSPIGSLLWVRTFAGLATTATGRPTTYAVGQGSSLAVDGSGNILVAGSFSGTVDFGSGLNVAELASPNGSEAFVAKLDGSGNLAWARDVVGNGGDDSASAVVPDGSGGAVIAGSYAQGATFGATTLAATGASEAFVAHLDAGGQFVWAVGTRGNPGSNAGGRGLARDASGNLVAAGFIAGTVAFSGNPALVAAGSNDAVVWKLDATGHLLWARSWGSADYDSANAVAVDPAGNIFATGTFSGTVNFGTGASPDSLTAGTSFDPFVVKLDPGGNEQWARGFVGPDGWGVGSGIAVDGPGNLHVAGSFRGTVDFDPGAGVDNLTSVGYTDVFVAGLDSGGNLQYAVHAGQANANGALGVAASAPGAVAITGTYSGSIGFGTTTLPTSATSGVFVARLVAQAPPPPAPGAPILEPGSITGSGTTTSNTSPIFDVNQADPANTVRLLRDGVVVGQRVGPGAIQDPGPVPQGTYLYTATQVTPAGTPGPAGASTSVTILTTSPAAPPAPALLASDDSGSLGDGITNVRNPRLVGTAPAGDTVQIVTATGSILGSAVAAGDGSYSIVPAQPLGDGVYLVSARAVDLARNIGPPGAPFRLTILATPPAAPTAPTLLAADDSGVVGDNITSNKQPRLVVAAGPRLTVEIVNASGAVLGSATASAGGSYTIPIAAGLADGTYSLKAVAIDAAGNLGATGLAISLVILTKPTTLNAPGLLGADDTGVPGDGMTAVRRPRIVGTGSPGGKVDWLAPDGSVFASTTASATDGSYLLQPATALPNGSVAIRVRETDVAGNVGPASPPFSLTIRATPGDYFGTSRTDVGIFRPSENTFYLQNPTSGTIYARNWAIAGDVPISGDYFGDGHGDLAVFRPSSSSFYFLDPATNAVAGVQWGAPGAIPVLADYDGDGKADVAIFWPGDATFYVLDSSTNAFYAHQLGVPGDIPVPADYFGNGHADLAVFHPSTATFTIFDPVTGATKTVTWGVAGDLPVPADYEGVGHADIAVYRPSNQTYYALFTVGGPSVYSKAFGGVGDVPVAGDYFGNGHANLAVYRPSNSTFYALDPITNAYRVMPWGAPNIEKPINPILTANFAIGGFGPGHPYVVKGQGGAPKAPGAPPADPILLVAPLDLPPGSPNPVTTPGAKRVATLDHAIEALGLERWRPGA